MISVSGLRVKKQERTICCLDELQISAGERVEISGPNGSGKTTLLRVLAGLEADYLGTCSVDALPKERIYVHQSPYLFRGTIGSNVAYGVRAHRLDRNKSRQLTEEWLNRFGLVGREDESVKHLSGGERQRVALARAFVLQPKLLLLDEPLSQMDDQGKENFAEVLSNIKETTIVVASPVELTHFHVTKRIHLKAGR